MNQKSRYCGILHLYSRLQPIIWKDIIYISVSQWECNRSGCRGFGLGVSVGFGLEKTVFRNNRLFYFSSDFFFSSSNWKGSTRSKSYWPVGQYPSRKEAQIWRLFFWFFGPAFFLQPLNKPLKALLEPSVASLESFMRKDLFQSGDGQKSGGPFLSCQL